MNNNIMGNIEFNIKGRAEAEFKKAMNLIFDLKGSHDVNRYIVKNGTMYLFRVYDTSEKTELTPFPYKMKRDALIQFVWGWLNSLENEERHQESKYDENSDVWNEPAWRVYVDRWGHVMERDDGVVAIEASWAWIGK